MSLVAVGCGVQNIPEPSLREVLTNGIEGKQAISYEDNSLEATYHADFVIKNKDIFDSNYELTWVMAHDAIMVKKDTNVSFKVFYSLDGTKDKVVNDVTPLDYSIKFTYSGLISENKHKCSYYRGMRTFLNFDIHQEVISGFFATQYVEGIGSFGTHQRASTIIDLSKIKDHAGDKFEKYIPIISIDCTLSSCFDWTRTEGWTTEKGAYAPFSEWLFYKGELEEYSNFKDYLDDLSIAQLHLIKNGGKEEACSGLVLYGHEVIPLIQL